MNAGTTEVMRVIDPGFGASIQDQGRSGWRRFGVPPSGCMDTHAAECANRLLENERSAPVLEILFGGARFEMLQAAWIAMTGAAEGNIPSWRAFHASEGETISLRQAGVGVWGYLAVEGGFAALNFFGSASYYARGQIGTKVTKEMTLERNAVKRLTLPAGVSGRLASWKDQWDYSKPPTIQVWIGPQWKSFSHADREKFLTSPWIVKPESDRVGYRLSGPVLKANPPEIVSEAVRVGSIQVPENGQPIITMRDGPTVGGYPKIALVDESDLDWVAQTRPGQSIRFQLTQ
jgi:biotin-dependent carboxylase-like uncharacterized protein